ncbi:hypothetical protein ACF3NG_01105 [Aerococcaceae bacterium WGS1372]
MLGNLLILLGMGFFLKIFFDALKKAQLVQADTRNKYLIAHVVLGIAFIVIGRLIVA